MLNAFNELDKVDGDYKVEKINDKEIKIIDKNPVNPFKGSNPEDLPEFTDYSMRNRTYRYMQKDALYPFGYGLSYTDYEFTNAKIVENSITKDGITVDFDVKNIGKVDGRTTVQVYVKANRDNTPNAQLKFFEKVALAAGESKKLSVKLPLEAFGLYDEAGKMNVLAGEYTVYVGDSQPDKRSCELLGRTPNMIKITCEEEFLDLD